MGLIYSYIWMLKDMEYLLLIISLNASQISLAQVANFETMDQCFTERDEIVELMGRPIINYQVICLIKADNTLIVQD